MSKFQVIVGNIGTVYDGNNFTVASTTFNQYVKASKAQDGRASGESVVLMHNNKIRKEHEGAANQE
jgi:hypothetical protein